MTVAMYSMRSKQLHNQIMDLKYKIDEIEQTKASLLSASDDLMPVGTDYDPESPVMKTLKARQERVKIIEKQLDKKLDDYKRQLEVAELQYQNVSTKASSAIANEFGGGKS